MNPSHDPEPRQDSQEEPVAGKYETPEIVDHGSLQELTLTGINVGSDSLGGAGGGGGS
jgi:hypothetical protein